MDSALVQIAAALGVAPLTAQDQRLLLDLARDVAYRTERRYAPLSAFLVGVAVGAGADGTGVQEAITRVRTVLPAGQDPPAN